MFYFKYCDDILDKITLSISNFSSSYDGKIILNLDSKKGLIIHLLTSDDEITPLKKSHPIYKEVFQAVLNKKWELFTIDYTAIEGIANAQGDIVEPMIALYPGDTKPPKINPYASTNELIISSTSFPEIKEESDVILKKRSGQYLHIYYRNELNVYHVCIDEFERSIFVQERFVKSF